MWVGNLAELDTDGGSDLHRQTARQHFFSGEPKAQIGFYAAAVWQLYDFEDRPFTSAICLEHPVDDGHQLPRNAHGAGHLLSSGLLQCARVAPHADAVLSCYLPP